ncbi:MAG: aminotransferase class I/II-fold pyridoxal phosphate-dependent enzyme [Bacteroidota bacterium]|nr:aminotransferase class I/II-fold pyridoxal phosphate-dependent enzyme [Kiloniellaceae bacterium]
MSDRRSFLSYHPFARLGRLLDDFPAGDAKPILLSVGEPKNQPPAFVAEAIAGAADGWSSYPPPRGSDDYRAACADWLTARYRLPAGMIDQKKHILPLPGSREGLFFAVVAAMQGYAGDAPPAVLLPNPFYHVYASSALAVGAEPVCVPATAATGFMPDYHALDPKLLDRTVFCFLNSPSNPQGAAASRDYLANLLTLARRHDFIVGFDECYSEIYDEVAPAGALEAAAALGGALDHLLVFHSLSKRSSAPGLRCGFVAGDAPLMDALDIALRVGGAGVSLPILAAGTRLWRDEAHVVANRDHYRRNFALAERILGNRFGFRKPDGGFFLWLDVGDGEAAALKLWREAGVRVLPGAYMAEPGADGVNPGARYIRVALVYDAAVTEEGLHRIVSVLSDSAESELLPAAAAQG